MAGIEQGADMTKIVKSNERTLACRLDSAEDKAK